MKYALIGCGRIATNHVKAVVNNKLEFAAVCDVVPEQMEALLAKHGLEKDSSIARYTDYKKMIEEVQPELVGIATESGIHAEIALYCIDHGVNCIIEKPIAMSMEDADETDTFAIIGATIADDFGVKMPEGTIGYSILDKLK